MTGLYCQRCGKAIAFCELCFFGEGDGFVCMPCRGLHKTSTMTEEEKELLNSLTSGEVANVVNHKDEETV